MTIYYIWVMEKIIFSFFTLNLSVLVVVSIWNGFFKVMHSPCESDMKKFKYPFFEWRVESGLVVLLLSHNIIWVGTFSLMDCLPGSHIKILMHQRINIRNSIPGIDTWEWEWRFLMQANKSPSFWALLQFPNVVNGLNLSRLLQEKLNLSSFCGT